jgi:hypothetical protein
MPVAERAVQCPSVSEYGDRCELQAGHRYPRHQARISYGDPRPFIEWSRRYDHWAVTVERNGEQIVTISADHLCGRDLSAEDEETIRIAARHLLAFLGDPALDGPAGGAPDAEDERSSERTRSLRFQTGGTGDANA